VLGLHFDAEWGLQLNGPRAYEEIRKFSKMKSNGKYYHNRFLGFEYDTFVLTDLLAQLLVE
jgi:hypothetical protein